jgi:hypothetical protein
MNSTTFSLLANSNPEVDENQEMELAIRSLSFYVGPSGSTHLSDPMKSGSSASKAEKITISGSSVGSSSEVNSPVSLAATEDMQEKFEEFNETRGKPDMEAIAVKTHDRSRYFAIESSGISRSVHQLCIIITEAAEEDNHEGNKEVDLQFDKPRSNSKKEKRENSCFNRRVENYHVSHQSRHRGTRIFKKRSVGDIPNRYTSDVVLNQQARVAHQGWYGGFVIPGGPVAEAHTAVQDAGAYGGCLDRFMADLEIGPWWNTDD